MLFRRNRSDEGFADERHLGCRFGQAFNKTVVITSAEAHARAVCVEGHSGKNDKIQILRAQTGCICRRGRYIAVAGNEVLEAFKLAQDHRAVFGNADRRRYGLSVAQSLSDQLVSIDLGAEADIQKNLRGVLIIIRVDKTADYLRVDFRIIDLGTFCQGLFPEGLFVHFNSVVFNRVGFSGR